MRKVKNLWVGHTGCPPTVDIANLKARWPIPSKVNQSHLFYLNFMPTVFLLNTYHKSKFPPLFSLNDRWPVTSVNAPNHISSDPRATSHLVFTHYNIIIIIYTPRRLQRTFLLIFLFHFPCVFLVFLPIKTRIISKVVRSYSQYRFLLKKK